MARSEDLITEAVGDELLVYDRTNQRAHCLSATAAHVWQACDGRSDPAAISGALGLPLDVVREAVEELEASELLDKGLEVVDVGSGNGGALTRRELAARSAKIGTAAAAGPLILSVAAPNALAATTPPAAACVVYSGSNCGSNPGGCSFIPGCCCCCQYQLGNSSCTACTSDQTCSIAKSGQPCQTPFFGGPATRRACFASGGSGTGTPGGQGCCTGNFPAGQPPNTALCGCVLNSAATGAAAAGQPGAGGPGGGGGCCNTAIGAPGTHPSCSADSAPTPSTCVPCCNGFAIDQTGNDPNALVGCCTAATGTAGTCPVTTA